MSLSASINYPSQTILSGPSASIMGAIPFTGANEEVLILDIGGTTTDMAIILNQVPLLEPVGIELAGYKTRIRALQTRSIGLGGDSALKIVDGALKIGPERRGDALAFGGPEPTPTDALCVLGKLNKGDVTRAAEGIKHLAAELTLSVEQTAQTIYEQFCRAVLDEAQTMVNNINSKPFYTVHEYWEDHQVRPDRILLMGSIDLTQRNFDITDIPESPGEFFAGRSFRGAGQSFRLALQPGNEFSNYSVSFSEPHLLNSDYSISNSAFFRTRDFDDFDERRFGGTLGFGRRFGDVWSGSVQVGAENIEIDAISSRAPVDIFDVEGENLLTTVGFAIQRDTIDNRLEPQRGSRLSFGIERAGAIGGDFDYTRLSGNFNKFWTLQRDFLDRPSVLSLRLEGGWIVEQDESPVFERFFAGGQRSFRGFEFRGVGPRGVTPAGTLSDDAVGGDWLLLLGLQYEFPLFGESLRGVVFTDQGTVQEDVGLDQWRVSIGTGVRIQVPFVSQVPFALDFAIPIREEENDETTIFSFNIDVPLQ